MKGAKFAFGNRIIYGHLAIRHTYDQYEKTQYCLNSILRVELENLQLKAPNKLEEFLDLSGGKLPILTLLAHSESQTPWGFKDDYNSKEITIIQEYVNSKIKENHISGAIILSCNPTGNETLSFSKPVLYSMTAMGHSVKYTDSDIIVQ